MDAYMHPMFLFEFGVSFGGAFLFLGMMWWDLRKENRKAEEAKRLAAAQAAATNAEASDAAASDAAADAPVSEAPPAADHP
ncbi:MAG: hypothetical protein KJT01_14460 [Gemmatimonadetes bacterium]|nr:hypothetical protein [Gemmatimonadota bacterium]